MKPFCAIIIIAIMAIGARPAQAQSLNFMFSMTVSGGSLTGEIFGLTSGTTSTPTEITIFTQPSGYPVAATSLIANGYSFYGPDSTFTVNSSGVLTGGDVLIYKAVTGGYQGYAFNLTDAGLGVSNQNGIFQANNSLTVTMSNANSGGFAGVTYTAVPETRQTALIFLLAGLGLLVGRKLRGRLSRPLAAAPIR